MTGSKKRFCPKCGAGNLRELSDFAPSGARRLMCHCGHRCNENTASNSPVTTPPKILITDIETSPMLNYQWTIWQQGCTVDQIFRDWHILTWAARWLGESETMFDSMYADASYKPWSEDDSRPVKSLWKLFDEADWIITHNGDKFDIKKMNTRFILHGLGSPSPYKSIDTLKIAKRYFSFTSNKLEYISKRLCGRGKVEHEGHGLWRKCIAGDRAAWQKMLEYNIGDIDVLEEVYFRLRGWDRLHPSFITFSETREAVCTVCGSANLSESGTPHRTNVSIFPGYRCDDCGHFMRGRKSIVRDSVPLVNAP